MLDQILALVAAQVTAAYNQGVSDGVAKAAAPMLAIESEMGSDLDKVKAEVQALIDANKPA